jgi:hypothetical protein
VVAANNYARASRPKSEVSRLFLFCCLQPIRSEGNFNLNTLLLCRRKGWDFVANPELWFQTSLSFYWPE